MDLKILLDMYFLDNAELYSKRIDKFFKNIGKD